MKKENYEFDLYLDFGHLVNNGNIKSVGVGPQQDAIILVEDAPGRSSMPEDSRTTPCQASVYHYDGSSFIMTPLMIEQRARNTYCFIQPLHEGNILLVAPRCLWLDNAIERNALVFNADGQLLRGMALGDAIEHVQVSKDQQILVGYFDDGIVGGLNQPKCITMLSESGLTRFTLTGEVDWKYSPPKKFDGICDCYAVNVANDATWVCYKTALSFVQIAYEAHQVQGRETPLVKITNDTHQVQGWQNPYAGIKALAIDNERILLWGGYGDDATRCVILTIHADKLVNPKEINLRLPDGDSSVETRFIGRDSILHAFVGSKWYQFDLRNYHE